MWKIKKKYKMPLAFNSKNIILSIKPVIFIGHQSIKPKWPKCSLNDQINWIKRLKPFHTKEKIYYFSLRTFLFTHVELLNSSNIHNNMELKYVVILV